MAGAPAPRNRDRSVADAARPETTKAAIREGKMAWRTRLAVLVLLLSPGAASAADNFGIGTSPQGTVTYSIGASIAKIAAEKAGLSLRVQPYSGTTQAVPLVNTGELDFGLANVLEASSAYAGTSLFNGKPNPNLRAVAVLYPLQIGFFVKKDSPIRSIKDLKGHALPVGYSGQAIIKILSDGMLASAGLTDQDIRGVPVPNIVRGTDDFIEGKADAFFFAVGAGKVAQANASVGGIRMLPAVNTSEGLAALRKFVPQAYITTVEPSKQNVGVEKATEVVSIDYLLFAAARVPDDVVYKLAKALHDNKAALVASYGSLADFNPERMAKKLPFDYHAGALKFYKEAGLWPPKD
jgi:TRAP transporter TAXI family solute receptor